MKKFMSLCAVILLVFGGMLFSPRSCCPDNGGSTPPIDQATG